MHERGENSVVYLATCFFIISNILDHSGELLIKYISFFISIWSLTKVSHKISLVERIFIVVLIFFFLLAIFITLINRGDLLISISNSYFLLTSIFYIFLVKQVDKVKILQFVMNILFFCSLMIISGNIFSVLYPIESVINFLKIFAMSYDEYEGIRENTINLMPRIYFHFTLFLPAALAFFLLNKKYLKSLFLIIAVILSVSRGAIISSLFVIFISIVSFDGLKNIIIKIIAYSFITFSMIFTIDTFVPGLFDHISELNNLSNRTIEVRNHQINTVLDLMFDDIFNFLFGMGSGTPYYSTIHQQYIYNIEIAPLEIFRRHGLIFLIFSFGFIFTKIFENIKSNKVNAVILVSLLFATITNPILTSPLFILIFFLSSSKKYIFPL